MEEEKTPQAKSSTKDNFFKDYQALMASIERLKKDEANPFFKSKYVPLRDVLAEVKKACEKNNFVFYQYPKTGNFSMEDGKIIPVTTLMTIIEHKDGRKIDGEIQIVSKDFTDPQKVGAGLTYMRRYSLTCMFGIEEEDDDSNKATAPKKEKKVNNVKELIKKQCDNMNSGLETAEQYKEFVKTTTGLELDEKNYSQILEKLIEAANQKDKEKKELENIGDNLK